VIQKHIVNTLSQKILEGDFLEGDTVEVGLDQQGLIEFKKKFSDEVDQDDGKPVILRGSAS
jgi:ATP-dependent Clp protease ATP-binding subunit ClpA